jgi:hypothetical protein
MFSMPAQVYKAGTLVAEDGEVKATPQGTTLTT